MAPVPQTLEQFMAQTAQFQQQQQQQVQLLTQQMQQMATAYAALQQQTATAQAAPAAPGAAAVTPTAAPTVELKKPRPPSYDGVKPKDTLQPWLCRMELYLKTAGRNLDTPQAVDDTVPYLDGSLITWYALQAQQAPGGRPYQTFQELAEALRRYLLPQDQVAEARNSLYKITQSGPVTAYNQAYNTLLLKVPDMAEGDRLQLYIRGLKQRVRELLLISRPATLAEAMSRAADIDSVTYEGRRQQGYSHYNSSHSASAAAHSGPTPMELGNTQAEVAVLRCYNCNEAGHYARDCPRSSRQQGSHRSNNGSGSHTGNTYRGRGRGRGPRGRGRSTNNHRGAPN